MIQSCQYAQGEKAKCAFLSHLHNNTINCKCKGYIVFTAMWQWYWIVSSEGHGMAYFEVPPCINFKGMRKTMKYLKACVPSHGSQSGISSSQTKIVIQRQNYVPTILNTKHTKKIWPKNCHIVSILL